MSEPIKTLLSKSRHYKAEIYQRDDSLFTYSVSSWISKSVENLYGDYWSEQTRRLSLFNSVQSAVDAAIEDLRNLSGEMDFMFITSNNDE